MANKNPFESDLFALARLRDEDIDTSDIPERADFSNAAMGKYFHIRQRDYDVRAIANWFLEKAALENIKAEAMWLNKIVYFAYEAALKEFSVLITKARVEAWDHGPVFREVFHQFDNEKNQSLLLKLNIKTRKMEVAREEFVPSDLAIFEQVWHKYGHASSAKLRHISHQPGTPWHVVWTFRGRTKPGMVIDLATILGRSDDELNGKRRNQN